MENSSSDHMRQAEDFARRITAPVFIVDTDGNVLFYNEAAGTILGRSFSDTGPIAASAWTRIFLPTDESGAPLVPDFLPLMVALNESRPNYGTMWIEGIDNVRRHIGVAAFPISDSAGKHTGAIAVFWEI